MQDEDISYQLNNTSQEQATPNVALELSKLRPEISSKIMNNQSSGGRSLNALWGTNITPMQKLVLVYLGSKIDFAKGFINTYESVSLSEIIKQTGAAKNTVLKVLKGLCKLGYIEKKVPKKHICITLHVSASYCLTNKAFDEYTLKLITWNTLTPEDTKQRIGFYSLLHYRAKSEIKKVKVKANSRASATDELAQNIIEASSTTELDPPPSAVTELGLVQSQHQGWFTGCTSASAVAAHFFLIVPNSSQIIPVCAKTIELENSLNSECTKKEHIKKESEEEKGKEENKDFSKSENNFQDEITLPRVTLDKDINRDISIVNSSAIAINKDVTISLTETKTNDFEGVQNILAQRYDESLSKSTLLQNFTLNSATEQPGVLEANNPHKIQNIPNQATNNPSVDNRITSMPFQTALKTSFLTNQAPTPPKRKQNFEKDLSEMGKKLKDTACVVFKRKIFIPFGDCEKAILNAMDETSVSLEEITIAIEEKVKYGIFSGQSISSMTNDLVKWINSKEEIISQHEQKIEEERILQERKNITKEEAGKQMIVGNKAELGTGTDLKDKEQEPLYLTKQPQDFQNWYNYVLNKSQQKAMDKDAMKMSEEQLTAYVKSILNRTKIMNKPPVFDCKTQPQRSVSM